MPTAPVMRRFVLRLFLFTGIFFQSVMVIKRLSGTTEDQQCVNFEREAFICPHNSNEEGEYYILLLS